MTGRVSFAATAPCIRCITRDFDTDAPGFYKYAQDVDYLEAYLEAANPDWREEVAGQAGEQAPASPHEILGIDRNASAEEARAAYRELQKHLHPDRQKAMGTQFPDIFAKWVTQAYTEFTASKEG